MKSDKNSVVAIFESHERAEDAIRELQKSGFDMKKLSIIGKDYHTEENVVGYYNTGDRMKYWGKLGAFWGGFWGCFSVPPSSGCRASVLCSSPDRSWCGSSARSKSAAVMGGLSALGAAFYGIGIPKDSVLQYETQVKNGKLVLVAHGSPEEVAHAKDLLDQSEATSATVHGEHLASVGT